MDRGDAVAAALQLQHDAGLMTSNLQVLGQFVTSLNHLSSEVMRLAFGKEVFPSDAVDASLLVPHVPRATHYMASMGLWRLLPGHCRSHPAITVLNAPNVLLFCYLS